MHCVSLHIDPDTWGKGSVSAALTAPRAERLVHPRIGIVCMFCRGELGLHPTHALAKVLVSAIAGNLGRCAQVRPVVPVILLAPGAEAAIGILTRLALPEFGFHMPSFFCRAARLYTYTEGAAFMHRRCLDSGDFPGISGVYFQRSALSQKRCEKPKRSHCHVPHVA